MADSEYFKLSISDLRIWVSIGCSDEEKLLMQCVSFDIEILFLKPPNATKTDNIEDTVCYAGLVRDIQELCQGKKFNLIEYLGAEIHNLISHNIHTPIEKIRVKTTKITPLVQNIHGGVSFTYCK